MLHSNVSVEYAYQVRWLKSAYLQINCGDSVIDSLKLFACLGLCKRAFPIGIFGFFKMAHSMKHQALVISLPLFQFGALSGGNDSPAVARCKSTMRVGSASHDHLGCRQCSARLIAVGGRRRTLRSFVAVNVPRRFSLPSLPAFPLLGCLNLDVSVLIGQLGPAALPLRRRDDPATTPSLFRGEK
ncbi:hypothetical protein NL676_014235 [Syzygium grande]|nr:hypothetical protein NL676_014235 [Syzygium grande]